jgi:hypothetical protein
MNRLLVIAAMLRGRFHPVAMHVTLVTLVLSLGACAPKPSEPPARGNASPAPPVTRSGSLQTTMPAEGPAGVVFENTLELISYRLSQTVLRPGDVLEVPLRWRALAPVGEDLRAFVELTNAEGDEIAGDTDVIGTRARPTSTWAINDEGEHIPRLTMPSRSPGGRAELRVGILNRDEVSRLAVSFHASLEGGVTWTTLAVFTSE